MAGTIDKKLHDYNSNLNFGIAIEVAGILKAIDILKIVFYDHKTPTLFDILVFLTLTVIWLISEIYISRVHLKN